MSHFVSLVFGCETEKDLELALAPYEESDPKDQQFVEFIDYTEEVLKKWNDEYSNKVLKEPGKKSKLVYANFNEYLADYGYIKKDDKYGYISNTMAKWDWYQVGGRWTGYFKLKDKTAGEDVPAAWNHSGHTKGYSDHCQIKDIDFEGMISKARVDTLALYAKYKEAKGDTVAVNWADIREAHDNIDDAREAYHKTPYATALTKARSNDLLPQAFFSDDYMDFCEGSDTPEEDMIQNAVNSAITPFACLKDGEWFEKGDMGWFGCVTNKKEQDNWDCEFLEILRTLPEDTYVTVVDCHI